MHKADLHLHTRYSDGFHTVEEIVAMAKAAGLTHIAMTDHDNLDGWSEKAAIAARAQIITVKSIEISAIDPNSGKLVHILGYNIKDDTPLNRICDPIKQMRNDKAYRQVEALNRMGYEIDYDELYSFAKGYIFKQHIFELLFRSNQVEAMFPSINDTLFRKGRALYEPMRYIPVAEAVRAVKESGGYAVLAHPNQQDNLDTVERIIDAGLDGIELNHEANDARACAQIRACAAQYGLILTGGSDYHGAYARRTDIVGSYLSEESGYRVFE